MRKVGALISFGIKNTSRKQNASKISPTCPNPCMQACHLHGCRKRLGGAKNGGFPENLEIDAGIPDLISAALNKSSL